MRRFALAASLLVLVAFSWGCGGGGAARPAPVLVPPQIDLHPHETIGVMRFDSAAKGELGPMATRRFTEAARRDQGLVKIVELGSAAEVLRSVGRTSLDPEAVKAIGAKHGLKSLIVGDLAVSNVKPNVSVDALFRSGSVTATVDATLNVQLYETETGAALWNRSGRSSQSVGHVSVWGGKNFAFDAGNPDEAYGGLVDDLVSQVSRPFQASWARN
jgi:hypothetical protein